MGNFNPLLRCMQLRRLLVSQQGGAMCCFSKLISGPYHHNNQVGAPSPSSNLISRLYHHNNQVGVPSPSPSSNVQTHLLPFLSPNNCYLFVHEPATCDLEDETPPYTGPDRLYSLAAAAALDISQNYKENIDKGVEVLNIIKNNNRLQVDLSNSACVGSSRGWLLFVNRTTLDLHLLNPFDANPHIIPLPTIKYLPSIFGSGNKCEDEIVSVTRFTISSTPFGGDSNCHNNDCIVMILCSNYRLAFCRLGGDKMWTALRCISEFREPYDMLYSSKEKLFYVFCGVGMIEAWDLHTDPSSPKLLSYIRIQEFSDLYYEIGSPYGSEDYDNNMNIYVVDSHSGKLLRLIWHADYNRRDYDVCFDVFELYVSFDSFEQDVYMHTHVDDLGDRALLLDHNQATFVSASQFPDILKPNSIYYIREGDYSRGYFTYMKYKANAGLAFTLGDKSPVKPLFPSITEIIPMNSASWVIPPHAIL